MYCWYVGNRQSSSSSYIPSIISSATTASNAVYVHTGVRAFKMYTYKYTSSTSSTNADSAYVIVPEIDYGPEGLQGAAIRFYARSYGSSTAYYKHVQIGVIKNRNIRTYQSLRSTRFRLLITPEKVTVSSSWLLSILIRRLRRAMAMFTSMISR